MHSPRAVRVVVTSTLLLGSLALAACEGGRPGIVGEAASAEIISGGLLAGGEELIFRGVLLEGLRSLAGLSSPAAIAVAALAFGLCHLLPNRQLYPFAFWAVWEGALLGGIYVLSGSLLVAMVVHILHDIGGFMLFAWQRRRWQSPDDPRPAP